jgi:hypothetical protein
MSYEDDESFASGCLLWIIIFGIAALFTWAGMAFDHMR